MLDHKTAGQHKVKLRDSPGVEYTALPWLKLPTPPRQLKGQNHKNATCIDGSIVKAPPAARKARNQIRSLSIYVVSYRQVRELLKVTAELKTALKGI